MRTQKPSAHRWQWKNDSASIFTHRLLSPIAVSGAIGGRVIRPSVIGLWRLEVGLHCFIGYDRWTVPFLSPQKSKSPNDVLKYPLREIEIREIEMHPMNPTARWSYLLLRYLRLHFLHLRLHFLLPCLIATTFPSAGWLTGSTSAAADSTVAIERSADTADFGFKQIPAPAISDAGAKANWRLVRGVPSPHGASIDALFDGKIPASEDSPSENFFFENGTSQGSVLVDLGAVEDLSQVATYSWHPGERAPQVYALYGLEEIPEAYVETWDKLAPDQAPDRFGWKLLAQVDTNPNTAGNEGIGGQHASLISANSGSLGKFRYLLFDCQPSAPSHPFGQTFFSEIDIVTLKDRNVERVKTLERESFEFSTADDKYRFTIDTTAAPKLKEWSEKELKPVILAWYPKIVEMLPSDGFTAPNSVTLRFLPNAKMNGIPAYAQNNRVTMNAEWYGRELKGEAIGATVHELVHVVQQYGGFRARGQRRAMPGSSVPTPGWITEGVPDYIRWFLYEPQTRGAIMTPQALANAKHDASYRTSANFIDYVIRTHDSNGTLLQKLNAAAREGRYSVSIWKDLSGLSVEELEKNWRAGK